MFVVKNNICHILVTCCTIFIGNFTQDIVSPVALYDVTATLFLMLLWYILYHCIKTHRLKSLKTRYN